MLEDHHQEVKVGINEDGYVMRTKWGNLFNHIAKQHNRLLPAAASHSSILSIQDNDQHPYPIQLHLLRCAKHKLTASSFLLLYSLIMIMALTLKSSNPDPKRSRVKLLLLFVEDPLLKVIQFFS